MKPFPLRELRLIDLTTRLFTEPALMGDVKMFEKVRDEEWLRKNEMLLELGVSAKDLQSANKFAAILEAEGVTVEYKDGAKGPIPAVAATDDFMKGLAAHDDPTISALALARLEVRSTIDETRAGRLAEMARRGPIPVYLGYAAAQTTRWGGGDKVNFQNLPRGSDLRRGLYAAPGCLLAIIDASQIEARLLNWCAGQTDIVEKFRRKEDIYSEWATMFYGYPVSKALPAERGLGKLIELSCGYGSGGPTIQKTAARGSYGPPVILSDAEGLQARDLYRSTHRAIAGRGGYWEQGDDALRRMASMEPGRSYQWGVLGVEKDRLILPNDCPMHYRLEWDSEVDSWRRKTRRGWVRIWGGVVAQNVMEGLGRAILGDVALQAVEWGLKPVLLTHDEIVCVVPESDGQAWYDRLENAMRSPPAWAPDIPLDAEGALDKRYVK